MLTAGFRAAYAYPTDTEAMNYNSVILVGVVALSAIWWVIHARKNYPGPKVMHLYIHEGMSVSDGLDPPAGALQEKQEKTVG